jgi:transcriptional regulator with XRE-family HTH domain
MTSTDNEPKLDPKPVGRRLQRARTALQRTQEEFGARAGIRNTTVGNYETGARLIPPGAAVALCEAWGLTLDYIYTGEMGNMQHSLAKAIQSLMDLEAGREESCSPYQARVRRSSKNEPKIIP